MGPPATNRPGHGNQPSPAGEKRQRRRKCSTKIAPSLLRTSCHYFPVSVPPRITRTYAIRRACRRASKASISRRRGRIYPCTTPQPHRIDTPGSIGPDAVDACTGAMPRLPKMDDAFARCSSVSSELTPAQLQPLQGRGRAKDRWSDTSGRSS